MINKRKISLTSEIGDWTLFQPELEKDITIGNVGVSDFDRLSKDQMELAHRLHYQSSEQLVSLLRNDMKVKLDLYYVEAIQLSYGDFKQSILKDDMVHVIVSLGGSYDIGLYVSRKLANALLERSLGGKCEPSESHLSNLEEKVFEAVANELIQPLLNLCDIDVDDVSIKDVSDVVVENLVLSEQSTYNCYVSKLSVANNDAGLIKYCYDRDTLLMLLNRYEIIKNRQHGNVLLDSVTQQNIDVKVNVELGSANVTMSELKNLTQGDVIALDSLLTQPLSGSISDKVEFLGYPGIQNGKVAIQLAEVENSGVFNMPESLPKEIVESNVYVETLEEEIPSIDSLVEDVQEEQATDKIVDQDLVEQKEEAESLNAEVDTSEETAGNTINDDKDFSWAEE